MKIRSFIVLMLMTVSFAATLFAGEIKDEQGERVPVGSIEEAAEEAPRQQAERLELARQLQLQAVEDAQALAAEAAPVEDSALASAAVANSLINRGSSLINSLSTAQGISLINYPGAYHPLMRFLGNEVRLEDGSWWKIYSGDFNQTSNWVCLNDLSLIDIALGVQPDQVVITANMDWPKYSFFRYHLTNQQTGNYVRVNLNDFYNTAQTRYIYSLVRLFDANGNLFVQLTLNDGSIWNTLPIDTQCLEWHVGDIMIVGVNTDQFAAFAPYLLINVRTNNNGAASCVLYYN